MRMKKVKERDGGIGSNRMGDKQTIRETDTESKTETHTQRTLTMKSLETRSRDRHPDEDRE